MTQMRTAYALELFLHEVFEKEFPHTIKSFKVKESIVPGIIDIDIQMTEESYIAEKLADHMPDNILFEYLEGQVAFGLGININLLIIHQLDFITVDIKLKLEE